MMARRAGSSGPSAGAGATGATATGPSETEPVGPSASGPFAGPVSIDVIGEIPNAEEMSADGAFYACDGVFGNWHYLFSADFGNGIAIDVSTSVDMAGGTGTMRYGDTLSTPIGDFTWQDTVKLRIVGTADAPAMEGSNLRVRSPACPAGSR